MMEADARVDDDVRAKCQADALHEVGQLGWLSFDVAWVFYDCLTIILDAAMLNMLMPSHDCPA